MADERVSATRAGWLELREERRVYSEGYSLLDEKRMLLAAEILRGLRVHEQLAREHELALGGAREALAALIAAGGCDGAESQPVHAPRAPRFELHWRGFLGVRLPVATLELGPAVPAAQPLEAAAQAAACARAFQRVIELGARQAALEASLLRLAGEYQRAQRRARALENVLIPELDLELGRVAGLLEAVDQEEAVRVRRAVSPRAAAGGGTPATVRR